MNTVILNFDWTFFVNVCLIVLTTCGLIWLNIRLWRNEYCQEKERIDAFVRKCLDDNAETQNPDEIIQTEYGVWEPVWKCLYCKKIVSISNVGHHNGSTEFYGNTDRWEKIQSDDVCPHCGKTDKPFERIIGRFVWTKTRTGRENITHVNINEMISRIM